MIIDRIENIGKYRELGENFKIACEWLRARDPSAMKPGEFPIDEKNVFASLADNELTRRTPAYEAHRLYADIQLIISGHERFGFGTEGTLCENKQGSDFYPCQVDKNMFFVLESGWFVIFLPGEIHAPGNPVDRRDVCRKMVIKVYCPEMTARSERDN